MHAAFAFHCCLSLAIAASTAQAEASSATRPARAGDNSAEWARALAAASPAELPALEFLLREMPYRDAQTLKADFLLGELRAALLARSQMPWGKEVPDELFFGYVLPYALANEDREDWRRDFARRFQPLVQDCQSPGEAALRLNARIFDELGVHYSTGRARADQAPSASIAQGKASCTGLSILLAAACRACCVPARLLSVRWPHKPGNHTWVEIHDGKAWRFLGADEPDPQGLDRGWFVGDAAQCATAERRHRIWAVSFAATGERFQPGWAPGIELWGTDETARYAAVTATAGVDANRQDPADAALLAQLQRYFAASAAAQQRFEFDRNLDEELRHPAGDARLRRLAAAAFFQVEGERLRAAHAARLVRAGDKASPFTVKQVGERPAGGWPLVIAMHGGGGVPKQVNDSQWQHMQVYYKDHPEAGGYLYCALRAPTDEWNGFYTGYFYPVLEQLIRQFVVCDGVDPERVYAIGYSHGGYGAFALAAKLPHRFAAVHASAAAPTDGETLPTGLHSLPFSFMVGGRDTAYGRRERCEQFAALLTELRQAAPQHYPFEFTLVEKNGHTGLPDRDLLPQLLIHQRQASPRQLWWHTSDATVQDHYWLHLQKPQRGQELAAVIDGQRILLSGTAASAAELWLDARLLVLQQPVSLVVDGVERKLTPAPSLRTLCQTMAQRGDPGLAASWRLQ